MNCNRCNAEIKWPEPYVKGNLPLNLDGTQHKCQKQETLSSTKPSSKLEPSEALAECAAFRNQFEQLDAAKFESLAKIYISRMMSR